jgi:5-(carboxyamino)imidazole ribonucleotide mutase
MSIQPMHPWQWTPRYYHPAMADQELIYLIAVSDTDNTTLDHCRKTLQDFGVPCKLMIMPANWTARQAADLAEELESGQGKLVIAAGHPGLNLPAILASSLTKPVLGVPMEQPALKGSGLDALLATVQAGGTSGAASLAIGKAGAINAALQAVAILALSQPALKEELAQFRQEQTRKIVEAASSPIS